MDHWSQHNLLQMVFAVQIKSYSQTFAIHYKNHFARGNQLHQFLKGLQFIHNGF